MAVNSISRNLNKSINLSKVFSLSLRYSIYKVQTSFVSFIFHVRCELLYVSTSCRICQELFSKFFKFFCAFAVLQAFAFHRTTLILYHRIFDLSRTFSCFFDFLWFHLAARRRLAYISTEAAICQALFTIFCSLFCKFLPEDNCLLFAYKSPICWTDCC